MAKEWDPSRPKHEIAEELAKKQPTPVPPVPVRSAKRGFDPRRTKTLARHSKSFSEKKSYRPPRYEYSDDSAKLLMLVILVAAIFLAATWSTLWMPQAFNKTVLQGLLISPVVVFLLSLFGIVKYKKWISNFIALFVYLGAFFYSYISCRTTLALQKENPYVESTPSITEVKHTNPPTLPAAKTVDTAASASTVPEKELVRKTNHSPDGPSQPALEMTPEKMEVPSAQLSVPTDSLIKRELSPLFTGDFVTDSVDQDLKDFQDLIEKYEAMIASNPAKALQTSDSEPLYEEMMLQARLSTFIKKLDDEQSSMSVLEKDRLVRLLKRYSRINESDGSIE